MGRVCHLRRGARCCRAGWGAGRVAEPCSKGGRSAGGSVGAVVRALPAGAEGGTQVSHPDDASSLSVSV